MAFVPRTLNVILDDMVNYVRANTELTDFEVGSVIRTILEAAAIEDDEQYFQMVQLLDAFSIFTAEEEDLDDRAAEFNIIRLTEKPAVGNVIVQDGNLITNNLAFDVLSGAVTIVLDSSDSFPTSGFPYVIRIGEGTTSVEDVTVSANDTGTDTLTVSSLSNNHSIGSIVSFVSGAADINISAGMQVQTSATGTEVAIQFISTETGIIINGNLNSTPISVQASLPGPEGNVGVGRVREFTASPPFDGALVTNVEQFSGGRNVETDSEFRDRIRDTIQSLTRGTPLALKEAALGVADPVTGQRVSTANVLEDFVNDEVIVYVDDGTGFVPDQTVLATSSLDAVPSPNPGAGTLSVTDTDDFTDEGFIIVSPENPTQIELLEYESLNRTTNNIILTTTTTNSHDSGDEVVQVEVLSDSTDAGDNFFKTSKFPVVRNSQRLWVDTGSGFVLQTENTDYLINKGDGQIQLTGSGLPANSVVVINYTYYTGLIFQVQRIINGDPDDEVTFPGFKSAGQEVLVETPVIRRITVRVSISAAPGFEESDLAPLVQEQIETYISSLGINQDVILAEIYERSMSVQGMFNMIIQQPTADISIGEDELPVPFDANGNSLVTVL